MVCDQANRKENPYESANILSKLCYWWMASIYYKGVTRDLETEDLYEPVHSERSEVLGDQLEREWNKELMKQKLHQDKRMKKKESQYKPSLLRCVIRIYLWSFSFQTILTLVQNMICLNLRTLFLGLLITYFDPESTITKTQAYYYASGVVMTTIVSVLAGSQAHFTNSRIGMKIRVACSSLVYRKILKLSKTSLDHTAGGQIVNLLSNDVQKFDAFPIYLHYLWIAPMQVILVFYLIWKEVGLLATIAGMVACILQTIPAQAFVSKLSMQLRKKVAEQTDKRIELMNELISGIQVLQYTKLPREGPFVSSDTNRPPPTWPQFGAIDIENLNLKYDDAEPTVLKNINIHISPGQKIGIVGRTGAGKSSLIAALFRLAKLEGSLKIDGIDIQTIGLHDLRSKISIIPQEPTLFRATLRYNLDPFNELSDDYLWSALGEVELKESFTTLEYEVSEGGSNLSHPHNLLKISDGYFTRMVEETGNVMATELTNAAQLAYDSRKSST